MLCTIFLAAMFLMTVGLHYTSPVAAAADRVPTVIVVERSLAERQVVQKPVTEEAPAGYRWRVTYVPKAVYETGEREEEVIVRKPVIETAEREETVTVLRPITERSEREDRVVVRKPVRETAEREETVTVLRPVTETVQRAEQVLVQKPVTTYVWMSTTAGTWVQVPQTQYVSQWETRSTPQQTTRYEQQQEVRRVPTETIRYEEAVEVRKVPVETTRWVEKREVRKVPVNFERTVEEIVVQKRPYSEFKTLYEEKKELVRIDLPDDPSPTTLEQQQPSGPPRTFRDEATDKPTLPNDRQSNSRPRNIESNPVFYRPLVKIVSPRQQASQR